MPAPIRIAQRVYVVRRKADGLFLHCGKTKWTDDVAAAYLVSREKFKGLICADLGRDFDDFDMVEVVPALAEEDT